MTHSSKVLITKLVTPYAHAFYEIYIITRISLLNYCFIINNQNYYYNGSQYEKDYYAL